MKFNPEKQSKQLAEVSSTVRDIQLAITQATVDLQKQLNKALAQERKIRDAITEAMIKTGTKSFENDYVKLTYVAATKRKTLDTARIKEEAPEIYDNFTKVSPVKASVRIAVK